MMSSSPVSTGTETWPSRSIVECSRKASAKRSKDSPRLLVREGERLVDHLVTAPSSCARRVKAHTKNASRTARSLGARCAIHRHVPTVWCQWTSGGDTLGVRAATLTRQLDAMEAAGLVVRAADPGNRRVRRVELTPAGRQLFDRLRDAAREHDEQLRAGPDPDDLARVAAVLERMRRNVSG